MPYKVFVAGEEALAADANTYLMSQTVSRFTNATQRTSQLTAPVLNQLSALDSTPGVIQYWNGSAWVDVNRTVERYAMVDLFIGPFNGANANAGQVIAFTSPPYPTQMFLTGTAFLTGSGSGTGSVEVYVGGGATPAPTTAPHSAVTLATTQITVPFTGYWANIPASTALVILVTFRYVTGTGLSMTLRDTVVNVRNTPL